MGGGEQEEKKLGEGAHRMVEEAVQETQSLDDAPANTSDEWVLERALGLQWGGWVGVNRSEDRGRAEGMYRWTHF